MMTVPWSGKHGGEGVLGQRPLAAASLVEPRGIEPLTS